MKAAQAFTAVESVPTAAESISIELINGNKFIVNESTAIVRFGLADGTFVQVDIAGGRAGFVHVSVGGPGETMLSITPQSKNEIVVSAERI